MKYKWTEISHKVKETPAILVKGHKFTKGDELEDLVMIANADIT